MSKPKVTQPKGGTASINKGKNKGSTKPAGKQKVNIRQGQYISKKKKSPA